MKKILFVDDEGFFARPYIRELEKVFAVEFTDMADDAVKRIKRNATYELVVLDIMMPTPAGIASTCTGNGLMTGVWILGEIRGEIAERKTPILVLTNRGKTTVIEEIGKLGLPEGLVQVFAKQEINSYALPVRVQMMLGAREMPNE